jgi:hypothetical protein
MRQKTRSWVSTYGILMNINRIHNELNQELKDATSTVHNPKF